MQSPEEIDLKKCDAEREINLLLKDQELVRQEILCLQRQILGLQAKKKDLEIMLSKASHNVSVKRNEISILKSQFWAAKG